MNKFLDRYYAIQEAHTNDIMNWLKKNLQESKVYTRQVDGLIYKAVFFTPVGVLVCDTWRSYPLSMTKGRKLVKEDFDVTEPGKVLENWKLNSLPESREKERELVAHHLGE